MSEWLSLVVFFMEDKNTPDVMGYFSLCFLGEGTRSARFIDASVRNIIANVIKVGSNAIEHIIRFCNFRSYEAFGGVDILEPGRLSKHAGGIFKISSIPVSKVKDF